MQPTRYPLTWPEGWKRTAVADRRHGRFGKRDTRHTPTYSYSVQANITVFQAMERVLDELNRLGVSQDDVIVSTNLQTRLDGLPRSGQSKPADPGVAIYWQLPGKPMRCMAIDRYLNVEDNIAAIAATLDAMRSIERHGGASVLDRAFTGFTALPAPHERSWWEILGVPQDASRRDVMVAYRRLASENHPDRGGSAERMAAINRARDEGLAS